MNHSNDLPMLIGVILLAVAFVVSLSWQNIKDSKWFKKDQNEKDDHEHPHHEKHYKEKE